LKDLRLKG